MKLCNFAYLWQLSSTWVYPGWRKLSQITKYNATISAIYLYSFLWWISKYPFFSLSITSFSSLFEVNQTQPLQQFQYRLLQQITGSNIKTNEAYDSPKNSYFEGRGVCKKLIAKHLKIVWSGQDKSGLLVRGVFPNHKQEPYNQGGHTESYKGKFPELFCSPKRS